MQLVRFFKDMQLFNVALDQNSKLDYLGIGSNKSKTHWVVDESERLIC